MEQTWFGVSKRLERTQESIVPVQEPSWRAVPEPRVPDVHQGRPRLVFTRGPEAGSGFVLENEVTTIGRDPASDIVVNDITVSKRHAEIRLRGDRHVLVDGGSLNGTYLNRLPVDITELSENDEIWVGKARFAYRTY